MPFIGMLGASMPAWTTALNGASGLSSMLGSAASGIGSFMNSNFGGGLMSGLGSLVGGLFSNSSNAKQASKNRRMIRWLAKNRYQLMVDDLQKAGINPIYAVQGGSAPSVTGGAVPHMSDVVTPAIGSAISVAGAINKMKNESMVAESQANLNNAQALRSHSERRGIDFSNAYAPERISEQIMLMKRQGMLTEQQANNLLAKTIYLNHELQKDMLTVRSSARKIDAEADIAENLRDSLKNPAWNRHTSYVSDILSLISGGLQSANQFNYLRRFAR